VPLEKYVKMFTFTRFEPYGVTDHPNVRTCTSILDFIFRIVGIEYLGMKELAHVQPASIDLRSDGRAENGSAPAPAGVPAQPAASGHPASPGHDHAGGVHTHGQADALDAHLAEMMGDAPVCDVCGHLTVRNGTCYRCLNCGNSMGCS
jgi:ribonucleoside-diphosphate reductase alpha chain